MEITLKDLFLVGQSHEEYVRNSSEVEGERIPKNYSRILISKELEEKIKNFHNEINFLCVGEMWCTDCQLNITVVNKISQLNNKFNVSVISKGRGEKFLKPLLELKELKIPTIVILNKNYEKIGVFIERPEILKEVEDFQKVKMEYLKGKYLGDTILDIVKLIGI